MQRSWKWLVLALMCAGEARLAYGADQWTRVRSPHFEVLTDSTERDARGVAVHLEQMFDVFHNLLLQQASPYEPRITVLALKSEKGMTSLQSADFTKPGSAKPAGEFLNGDRNYMLIRLNIWTEHTFDVVYHEYTHYMVQHVQGLPLWLNEGIAQFYQYTEINDKDVVVGQLNESELRYLNHYPLMPLEALFQVDQRSPYYHEQDKANTFYSTSWLLTHYLLLSDRTKGTHYLQTYLQALANGDDSTTAARRAFGDLKKLQFALNLYLAQTQFMNIRFKGEVAQHEAMLQVVPVSMGEVDAVRANILMLAGRTEEGKELLEQALKLDPGNEVVQLSVGRSRLFSGDKEAGEFLSRALALDPGDYLAHYDYALALLRMGAKEQDLQIEIHLQAAIKLNPEFGAAYDALAMFLLSRNRILDKAQILSTRAIQLSPNSLRLRVDCAEIMAAEQQYDNALNVLNAALPLALRADDQEFVRGKIAHIQETRNAKKPPANLTAN